jgi:hypothetical protein
MRQDDYTVNQISVRTGVRNNYRKGGHLPGAVMTPAYSQWQVVLPVVGEK